MLRSEPTMLRAESRVDSVALHHADGLQGGGSGPGGEAAGRLRLGRSVEGGCGAGGGREVERRYSTCGGGGGGC